MISMRFLQQQEHLFRWGRRDQGRSGMVPVGFAAGQTGSLEASHPLRMGGDAESCAFADFSVGPGSGFDEMVERLYGQKREPDTGTNRAVVWQDESRDHYPRDSSASADYSIYRGKSSFGRVAKPLSLMKKPIC